MVSHSFTILDLSCMKKWVFPGAYYTFETGEGNVASGVNSMDWFQCKFASQVMAVVGLGFTKASLLVLFRGIFSVSRQFRRVSFIMLCIVVGWTVSFFFANLFTCYPITPFVESFYSHKCLDSVPMWYTSCITDVIVDTIIFIMPMPLVMRLHMPLRQRLGVAAIFFMGTT